MAGSAQVRFGAEVSDFLSALDKVNEKTAQSTAFQKRFAQGLTDLSSAFGRVKASTDPAEAASQKFAQSMRVADAALKAGMVDGEEYAKTIGQIKTAYASAGEGATGAGHATAGMTREFIVLGHEVVSGNFSRIPGSLMVLASRSGNLHGILAALTSPIGLVSMGALAAAAALGEMAFSSEHAERAMNDMKTAFAATGATASAAGIQALVDQMARLHGVSRDAAEEIVQTFGRTRQMSGEMIDAASLNIDRFARLLGKEAPEAAKELAQAMADPSNAAKEYNKSLGILDGSQLKSIADFQAQGRVTEAQAVLFKALLDRANEIPPGLTAIQTAADNLGNAWHHLTAAVGDTAAVRTAKSVWEGLLGTMTEVTKGAGVALNLVTTGKMKGAPEAAAPLATERSGGANRNDDSAAVLAIESKYQSVKQQQAAIQTDINRMLDEQKRLEGQTDDISVKRLANLKEEVAAAKERQAELGKKTGGASQMETWRAELAQQDAAANASRAEQLKADIAFWQAKRANLQAGSKDAVAIDREIARGQIALNNEVLADAKRVAQEKRQIAKADTDTGVQISRMQLEANKQLLEEGVAEHAITAQEKVQILKGFTEAAYQEDLKRLEDELATLKDLPKEYDHVYNEIRLLKARHEQDMASLDRQGSQAQQKAANDNVKAWEQAFGPISHAFSASITGMIMGTQTLHQAESRVMQNIVASVADAAQQMATKWIASKMAQLTATETADAGMAASGAAAAASEKATQGTSILGHAGSAAAAVYDDVAQIPYVGWILAPIAAAAAFAGVAAFSAEGGAGSVPYDNAPFLLHKNEMVLPASIANPLRSSLAGGTFNNSTSTNSANTSVTSAPSISVNVGGGGYTPAQGRAIAQAVAVQVRNANSNLVAALKGAGA